jgi:hypothetical protein
MQDFPARGARLGRKCLFDRVITDGELTFQPYVVVLLPLIRSNISFSTFDTLRSTTYLGLMGACAMS